MEHFLWVDSEASREVVKNANQLLLVKEEVADVACLLLNLCNSLEIDLSQAIHDKMAKNAKKYPVEEFRGRATR
jgi:NTP pyrophosphatase (non-canonical NTP hydrolase)